MTARQYNAPDCAGRNGAREDLIVAVSTALGVKAGTVAAVDRYLAEAGLRTRLPRGRGAKAAELSPLDAARLTAATALGNTIKDAAATVAEYADEITQLENAISFGALEEIQIEFGRSSGCRLIAAITPSGIDTIRAAIAKAEGRSDV